MIRSFADKRTENVFNGVGDRSFPAAVLKRAHMQSWTGLTMRHTSMTFGCRRETDSND